MELTHDRDEHGRLKDLKSYRILDTLPETSFDQLTVLAARVCETPVALLSFIDENRQWFKSSYGMDIKEIPRHLSACNTTIYQDGIFEITDSDVESCPYREFMNQHGLRFYAGVPIISKDGFGMGALCVVDHKPRKLSDEQTSTLKAIGSQIVENLDIRRKYQENLERMHELDSQLIVRDKKMMDWAHKRAHKAIAELASGLNYRIRPFLINIESNVDLITQTELNLEDKERLKSVLGSVKSIDSILGNLDKFVTAEKEKWMKVVEINSVLKEVLSHEEKILKEKNIELKVNMEFELRCLGNYSKLAETFHAIIRNAIEAIGDQKQGKIEIHLHQEFHKAIICIKDNGKGIDESAKPFLFQPFFTTKSYPSIGVGLALSKSHIEEHGGTIELVNDFNPTTFKITIPLPF
jgi:signal transduction histidine kinase